MSQDVKTQEKQVKVSFKENGKTPKKGYRYIIPRSEQFMIQKELSDGATLLFYRYMDRSLGEYNGQPLNYDDQAMAHSMGWTVSKVSRLRRELQKKHYMLLRTFKSTDRIVTYSEILFLGKSSVEDHLIKIKKGTVLKSTHTNYQVEEVSLILFDGLQIEDVKLQEDKIEEDQS